MLGGTPNTPTKEGCALSGLFRRAGSLRFAGAAMCKQSLLESLSKDNSRYEILQVQSPDNNKGGRQYGA